MKTNGGVETKLQALLTSAPREGERSATHGTCYEMQAMHGVTNLTRSPTLDFSNDADDVSCLGSMTFA
jgi:hypothetical protein